MSKSKRMSKPQISARALGVVACYLKGRSVDPQTVTAIQALEIAQSCNGHVVSQYATEARSKPILLGQWTRQWEVYRGNASSNHIPNLICPNCLEYPILCFMADLGNMSLPLVARWESPLYAAPQVRCDCGQTLTALDLYSNTIEAQTLNCSYLLNDARWTNTTHAFNFGPGNRVIIPTQPITPDLG